MATSLMARYVSEVAPPLFVNSIRRHCMSKVLDTIHEDEKELSSLGDSFSFYVKRSSQERSLQLSSSAFAPVSNKINQLV
ncbi:hypothetical protein DCAR_0831561 [Daucus carota subsp. sativus]|uniref:Uncharacterized protein n=1 Tax=Daucus carota subsp. sativus TaxID=79200 RepID=A0A175YMV5_DAUCS|nr:hypothetical protein DCAR_0831561 [Daucus carota subsp. sativus]